MGNFSVQVDVTHSSWPIGWSTLTANSMSAWNSVTPSSLSFSVGTTGSHRLKFEDLGWWVNEGITTPTLSGNTITDIETTLNSYKDNEWSWDGTPSETNMMYREF